MRVLVFGLTGQVATALRKCSGDINVICMGRDQANLDSPSTLRAAIEAADATVIINATAYTSVDNAETDADQAEQVNHLTVDTTARASARRGLPLLHVSTDYVFPGDTARPLNSRMDCTTVDTDFGISRPDWRSSQTHY